MFVCKCFKILSYVNIGYWHNRDPKNTCGSPGLHHSRPTQLNLELSGTCIEKVIEYTQITGQLVKIAISSQVFYKQ